MSVISEGAPAASRSEHDLADGPVAGERLAEERLDEERLADDSPAWERLAEESPAEATSEAAVSNDAALRGREAGIEAPGGQSVASAPSTDGYAAIRSVGDCAIRIFGQASFTSWCGVGAGVVLGAGCSASLGIAILGCLWVSKWLASAVLNAVRSPWKYRMRITVGAYMELDFLRNSSFREGVRYVATSLVLLGTVIFLLVALRLLPDLMWLAHGGAIQDQIARHFPAGVEILLRNGTLSLQPPQEELRVTLPKALFSVCGGSLVGVVQGPHMSGVADMLGVADLQLLDLLLGGWLGLALAPDVPDPYVRVAEFSVGERVEARLTSELVKCGAQRPVLPVPALGVWLQAVVEEVHHSTALRDMAYTLRLEVDADTLGVETVDQGRNEYSKLQDSAGSAGDMAPLSERCVVAPSSLRRLRPNALFVTARSSDGDEDKSRMLARLQDDAALLVFEEKRFAILEGFSFRHGQYWHYSNSQVERPRIWHNYTDSELRTYLPLACAVDVFCQQEGGEDDLTCSRERAQQNIEDILRGETNLPLTRSGSLQVVLLLIALWVVCVTATLVVRTFVLFLLYMPMVYLVCCLFRHVDTPLVPVGRICGLVLYSGMPPLYLFRLCHCVWKVYGGDSRLLHPWLLHPLERLTTYSSRVMALWSLWNGFLVIRMRELDAVRERRGRLAEARLQRAAAASGGGASQKAAATAAPEEAADSAGPAVARRGDDEGGLPTCRICFGGWEEGRLISPCLCSGTMRFVHLECLNMWRLGSANPQSCYQCEQCHYRYSLRRTRLATILRSALVLHVVTLVAFVCAVLLCSFASVWMQTYFFDSQRLTLTSDEFIGQLANGTELTVEEIRDSLSTLDSFTIFGLKMIHLLSGFAMVGISGLFIMGFSWFPLMRGHRGMGWPIAFLIGCVRVLILMYGFFKTSSGRLLRSMEDVVLEVGAAAEQGDCQGAAEGTEDAAGGAHGGPVAPTASAAGLSGQPVELSSSTTDIWPARAEAPCAAAAAAAAANDSPPQRSEAASDGIGLLQDAQRERDAEHWQLRRRSGPAEASEER